MKIRRQADGSFVATHIERARYVVIGRRGEGPNPICASSSLREIRRVAQRHATDTPGDGVTSPAGWRAPDWNRVEVWQTLPGTIGEPKVLLEAYYRDGTIVVLRSSREDA